MAFAETAPEARWEAYKPASGLTAFQRQVLAALSYTEPKRAINLPLGDPRGSGASLAALLQRGYVSGDGKKGYVRNAKVVPRMMKVSVRYVCDDCHCGFYPFEVSADMRQHLPRAGCTGPHLRMVDRRY